MAHSSARQDSSLSDASTGLYNSTFADLADVIVNTLPTGVVAFDSDLRILGANKPAQRLIKLEDYIDKSLTKGCDPKIFNDWTVLLKSSITAGEPADFNRVRYSFDGRKSLLHIVCIPIKNRPPLVGIVTFADVTSSADIEHQLAQAERLAAVGKVAQKVAHELNNPLDGILRYTSLAVRVIDNGDSAKAKDYINHSRDGLMRMVNIVQELLQFSRNTYTAFEQASIDKVLSDVVKIMEPAARNVQIKIKRRHSCKSSLVRANSLFQVFCNLVKNAIDAMQGQGLLTIITERSGDNIVIQFKDTGPGFAPENSERLFQPFFTTKGNTKGTGLGLAICKDIVESLSGTITAENSPEGGSIFTVTLPFNEHYSKILL